MLQGAHVTEINMDVYPERRAEMERMAKKSSAPQIFFNDEHIGGNDDLQALNASGGLDAKLKVSLRLSSGAALHQWHGSWRDVWQSLFLYWSKLLCRLPSMWVWHSGVARAKALIRTQHVMLSMTAIEYKHHLPFTEATAPQQTRCREGENLLCT